jgi:hypothetical protein
MFNKSRIALLITFVIVLLGVMVALVVQQLFASTQAPSAYFLWPPFAFYRALNIVNLASVSRGARVVHILFIFFSIFLIEYIFAMSIQPYTFSMLLRPGDEVGTALAYLFIEIFVYGLFAVYLTAVIPSEFGTKRPWHFPVTDPIAYMRRSGNSTINIEVRLNL